MRFARVPNWRLGGVLVGITQLFNEGLFAPEHDQSNRKSCLIGLFQRVTPLPVPAPPDSDS